MKEGKPIAATLEHLVFFPTSAGGLFPTIIAMHGRGADENDLASMVLTLEVPNVLLVTPRAPFALPYGGYVWYELGDEGVPDPETFQTSLGLLREFLEEVRAGYPVNTSQVILLGFSQGTVMGYATALTTPSKFRGLVALSGYMPTKSNLPLQLNNLSDFPVFISHGSNDPLIPVHFGREAAKLLTDAGAKVAYHEYFMGHEVAEATIRDLKKWILEVLGAR
jgi:phospholipase/carboxylesterase